MYIESKKKLTIINKLIEIKSIIKGFCIYIILFCLSITIHNRVDVQP